MMPKQKNNQHIEDIPQNLSCKLKDSSSDDAVYVCRPKDSSVKSGRYNNVIYLKLNNSGKVDNSKEDQVEEISFAEISSNIPVEEKVSQGLIVKHVLNKANNNSDFWRDLIENSSVVLSKFNLSREAKAAIASGDVQWVHDNVGNLPDLEREAW